MLGMFIMHPKEPFTPAAHRGFGVIIQEHANPAECHLPRFTPNASFPVGPGRPARLPQSDRAAR